MLILFTITSCSSSCEKKNEPKEIIIENYTVEIINQIPHSDESFTQGLLYHEDKLYESTGRYNHSSLQKLDAITGDVEQFLPVYDVFSEGLALHEGKLYQLTWREDMCFVYDVETFEILDTLSYHTEGWGLTSDGQNLIMSDGSEVLYFRDPQYFDIKRKIFVKKDGKPLSDLNELEYVDGCIYANIFRTNSIAKIDPNTGNVVAMIDAMPLYEHLDYSPKMDVLNGIAYNAETKSFYLTGKNWLSIFEVKFIRTIE
jgi:glutamine cyclotransferase